MATKYDATVRLLMENREFLRDARKSESAVDDVGRSGNRARDSFIDLGKRAALTFGAGGAIAGILAWANAGSELAVEAELVAKSMDQILGPASDRLIKRNEELATQMGLTRGEFEKAVLPFANVGESLGIAADENERLVGDLFTAAADLAVFNGEIGGTVEILEAMQSATRGEYDALQRFVPSITAAAVETKALAMTGKENASELTEQEKLMAAYALILEEAERAQGAANQAIEDGVTAEQAFNAELRETQTEVGAAAQELKQYAFTALKGVLDMLKWVGVQIANALKWLDALGDKGIPVISWLAEVVSQLGQTVVGVSGAFQRLGHAVRAPLRLVERLAGAIKRIPSRIPNPFRNIRVPSWVPGFQTGGTVPGPPGVPSLAVVHGGERVLTPQQQRMGGGGGGAGMTVNVTIHAGLSDPQTISREIVDLLTLYNRTNGAIPISTSDRGAI